MYHSSKIDPWRTFHFHNLIHLLLHIVENFTLQYILEKIFEELQYWLSASQQELFLLFFSEGSGTSVAVLDFPLLQSNLKEVKNDIITLISLHPSNPFSNMLSYIVGVHFLLDASEENAPSFSVQRVSRRSKDCIYPSKCGAICLELSVMSLKNLKNLTSIFDCLTHNCISLVYCGGSLRKENWAGHTFSCAMNLKTRTTANMTWNIPEQELKLSVKTLSILQPVYCKTLLEQYIMFTALVDGLLLKAPETFWRHIDYDCSQ